MVMVPPSPLDRLICLDIDEELPEADDDDEQPMPGSTVGTLGNPVVDLNATQTAVPRSQVAIATAEGETGGVPATPDRAASVTTARLSSVSPPKVVQRRPAFYVTAATQVHYRRNPGKLPGRDSQQTARSQHDFG